LIKGYEPFISHIKTRAPNPNCEILYIDICLKECITIRTDPIYVIKKVAPDLPATSQVFCFILELNYV